MNVTKQLYQWDTGQKLTECTGIYVDYLIGDEVYRVEITDGTCIIPDELLQTSGRYKVWECMADNTLREFAFKVLPRPVPPNYVFTPTEQLTFEGLVQKETNKFNTNAIEKLNAYNANADNRVAEFNAQTEQIQADVSELKSDLVNLTSASIKDVFDGNFESYWVNNNVLASRTNAKSVIVNAKIGAKYHIKASGNYNRFRIYGTNTIDENIPVEQIYRAEIVHNVSGEEYFYENTSYNYLIVFLDYDTADFSCDFNCIEKYGIENELKVNGVDVVSENKLHDIITFNSYSPVISNNIVNNGQLKINLAGSYGVVIEASNKCDYRIIIKGKHNRNAVYGGDLFVQDSPFETLKATTITYDTMDDDVIVVGKGFAHRYMVLSLAVGYDSFDGTVIVETFTDGVDNYNINGINVSKAKKYVCDISLVRNDGTIENDGTNLCLIATKTINENGRIPETKGYLYADIVTNKLYYSATNPDNPIYLCDWKTSVAKIACGDDESSKIKYWHFSITADGDIICLLNYYRSKPVIYLHDDYSNPIIVDGLSVNPYGLLSNNSIVQMADGTFYFGEYTTHKLSDEQAGDRRNIWKVTKPYANANNWIIDHSFKHVFYESPKSDEPSNEIGHIHSITFDYFTNSLHCNTGDIGRHCRIWRKKLDGGSWHEVACGIGDGQTTEVEQRFRMVNLAYTKDACWWGTDSFATLHNLYKAERKSNGDVDFETTVKITSLENFDGRSETNRQPTYATILLDVPCGILFIDRAEDRIDHKLDIVFYSFEDCKAHICRTFEKVPNTNGLYNKGTDASASGRVGFPNQVMLTHKPFNADYIMIGGADHIRSGKVDIFNNEVGASYVGALKIRVREVGVTD